MRKYPVPLLQHLDYKINIDLKGVFFIILLIILSNIFTFTLLNWNNNNARIVSSASLVSNQKQESLYLMSKATSYVYDTDKFESKVRKVSRKLGIPPEWLMSVMYSESKFDASARNSKGSGATGLIQWMPATAKDFDITVEKLRNLNHIEQLDFVYKYMNRVRKKYGSFDSLTEVYLAILYPKAIGEDYCYTLYASPSRSYKMNTILDENKDSRVTVKDIDDRMRRLYKPAYMTEKAVSQWAFFGF